MPDKMTFQMTSPNKSNICPHCGGRLFWDDEEKEPRCINCARKPNSDNHNGVAELIPPVTGEIAKAEKSDSKALPHKIEAPQVRAPTPEKIQTSSRVVPDKEWYAPGELTFSPHQVLFIIKNLPTLREGRYPPDPVGSGYVSLYVGKRAIKHKAYFEVPASIAAEISARLAMTGLDGLILEALELWEKTTEYLAKCLNMPEEKVIKRRAQALNYTSGWGRKRRTYRDYIGHRNGGGHARLLPVNICRG